MEEKKFQLELYVARSDNGDILMVVTDELLTEEKHL